ncbi:response regulator transcription factor [Xylanimonas protaetiae]|uniref:response regulator n=1 Tax=Xylanimonas protaetiae TaxID=2509457 RepID=UPI00315A75EA
MTSVLVADDQALVRSAVVDLVGHADGLDVVGEAGDGRRAVELARRLRPDVVLMDVRMPGMDGIAATREICDDPALADVRVLVLTTFEDDAYIVGALRAGRAGSSARGRTRTRSSRPCGPCTRGTRCCRRRRRARSSTGTCAPPTPSRGRCPRRWAT